MRHSWECCPGGPRLAGALFTGNEVAGLCRITFRCLRFLTSRNRMRESATPLRRRSRCTGCARRSGRPGRCCRLTCGWGGARCTRCSARTGRGSRPSSSCCRAITGRTRARCCVGGHHLTLGSAASPRTQPGCRFVHQDLGLIASETVLDNLCAGTRVPDRLGDDQRPGRPRARRPRTWRGPGLTWIRGGWSGRCRRPSRPAWRSRGRCGRATAAGRSCWCLTSRPRGCRSREVGVLLELVRSVTTAGVAVIYVSHRIDEVLEVAESVSVLRDGRKVASRPVAGLDHSGLVTLLTGDEVAEADVSTHVPPPKDAPVLLSVDGLSCERLRDVSFEVQAGRGGRDRRHHRVRPGDDPGGRLRRRAPRWRHGAASPVNRSRAGGPSGASRPASPTSRRTAAPPG